jgi:membrane protein
MAEETSDPNNPHPKPSPRKPHRVSKPGLKEILRQVKNGISQHHLSIVAAGIGFYIMLGLFPALAAAISIYGMVADPQDIQEQFAAMEGIMPEEANALILEQMSRISDEQTTAGIGAIVGILFALWAGSRGTKAAMEGLNITYEESETRGAIKVALIGLGLTLALVLLGLSAIAVIVVLPPLLQALQLPSIVDTAISIARWPVLLLIGIGGITLLYRYGPSRPQPTWKWLTWGSGAAAILWLIISGLFTLYVANFGDYNETYGALGGIIILLMWFYISAFAILLGAELDAAIEKKTEEEVMPETGQDRKAA